MDEATFIDIYEKTYSRVYRFCCTRSSADDAEDYAAETFERAFRYRDQLHSEDEQGVKAWLFTIAQNVITSHYRRRHTDEDLEEATRTLADPDREHDPQAMVDRQEDMAALSKLMEKLTPRQREILYLKAIVGLSNEEVAWAYKCSEVNVRVTNYRAFKRLQGMWAYKV